MSTENDKVSVGSYLIFPTIFLGAKAAAKTVRAGSPVKAVRELKQETRNFKALNENLKNAGVDFFSRSTVLAEKYDALQAASKQIKKGTKLSLKDKIGNLFRSEGKKVTLDAEKYATAKKAGEEAKAGIDKVLKNKNGAIQELAKEAKSTTVLKGVGNSVKSQLKDKFTYIFMIPEVISELKDNIVPAFKNEGFGSGMKQTGKSILKLAGSLASFVFGGSVGTAIGRIAGMALPGIGPAIGGFIGNMLGMSISGRINEKVVEKIAGESYSEKEQKQASEMQKLQQQMQNMKGAVDPTQVARGQAMSYQAQKLDLAS